MGALLESEFEIRQTIESLRTQNKKITLCHGVFDLLHPGHLEHLSQAARMGDILIVSITADQFVNKGPGRPAFNLKTRMLAMSRIVGIDFVIPSNNTTAIQNIELVRPDYYVKGSEYKDAVNDVTGMIDKERDVVQLYGGKLFFTEGFTSSSTRLINEFMSSQDPETKEWLSEFRKRFSIQQIVEYLEQCSNIRVGIVGEVIIDKYTNCLPLSKSSKDPILAFHRQDSVEIPGGVLAIANNCAMWSKEVHVFSNAALILNDQQNIHEQIDKKIKYFCSKNKSRPLIIKHRYIDSSSKIRLFETYDFNPDSMAGLEEIDFVDILQDKIGDLDLVVVADYGHGLMTKASIDLISESARFLCVNTQSNAGNRGYNTIAKYANANLICLNGSELQLELRDKNPNYFEIVPQYISRMNADYAILTLGGEGMLVFNNAGEYTKVPALASRVVDKVGAGDSVLAIGSLLAYLRAPVEIIGLLCSLVAAHEIGQLGHRTSLSASNLLKSVKGVLG